MYSLRNLLTAARYPRRGLVEVYSRLVRLSGGPNGVDIIEADWDNLIILDACRYDLFEEHSTLPGTLKSVRSRGTHTGEFLERNFQGGSFPDIVYVSAHPRPSEFDATFHEVYHLWEHDWDEELHTVPPETVVDLAAQAYRDHPNKRIIVHFLQPHYPFIGDRGREFHEEHGFTSQSEDNHVWIKLRRGDVEEGLLRDLYAENLNVVLPYAESLLEQFTGRTVVTSDHGNAFGEWNVYGHPPGAYIDALKRVPWLVIDADERKDITTEGGDTPVSRDTGSTVTDRLAELGYLDE